MHKHICEWTWYIRYPLLPTPASKISSTTPTLKCTDMTPRYIKTTRWKRQYKLVEILCQHNFDRSHFSFTSDDLKIVIKIAFVVPISRVLPWNFHFRLIFVYIFLYNTFHLLNMERNICSIIACKAYVDWGLSLLSKRTSLLSWTLVLSFKMKGFTGDTWL